MGDLAIFLAHRPATPAHCSLGHSTFPQGNLHAMGGRQGGDAACY